MKRCILICLMVFTGLCLSNSAALAGFYVISVPQGVGTEITSIPYTISDPGYYYLGKNLHMADDSGDAISIEADDVTVDFNGFVLSGPGKDSGVSFGISFGNRSGIVIRNGTIKNFGWNGISQQGLLGNSCKFLGMNVNNNGNTGIKLEGQIHSIIECTLHSNKRDGANIGIRSRVESSVMHNNGRHGVAALEGCEIIDNMAYTNEDDAVVTTENPNVVGNTVQDNGGDGLQLGVGAFVSDNCVKGNGQGGIIASGGNIIGNISMRNAGYGIVAGYNGYVDQNVAFENDTDGSGETNIFCRDGCTLGENDT